MVNSKVSVPRFNYLKALWDKNICETAILNKDLKYRVILDYKFCDNGIIGCYSQDPIPPWLSLVFVLSRVF